MKLDVESLCAGYGDRLVLDGVSLHVPEGNVATLLGPNGCGKSTLLKTIGRLLRPRSGTALLDGRSVHAWNTGELARTLAILPQLRHSPGELTVEELISYGRYPHRGGPKSRGRAYDREVVKRVIDLTRMTTLRARAMSTLSGGERQRAWIAMTLAQEPSVLLLDEPTTFLDIRCQFDIIELVREMNRRLGITVLMVLHDLNLAARCSDQMIMVKEQRIRHAGTPAEILRPEILREVFDIEAEIHLDRAGVPYCLPIGPPRA